MGAAGASSLDEVPGREDYDSNEEGALEWAEAALAFTEENFNDGGGEVRSHDQRDCKVGLFGDFLERMEHGKFFEWVQDMERGGLYTLQIVKQAREARVARSLQLARRLFSGAVLSDAGNCG